MTSEIPAYVCIWVFAGFALLANEGEIKSWRDVVWSIVLGPLVGIALRMGERNDSMLKRGLTFVFVFLVLIVLGVLLTSCDSAANVASTNLSRQADQFLITRKITFYNGITGENILVIEGLCSLGNFDSAGELSVTCKTGVNDFKKHFLGLSDNVTYVVEQIDGSNVDPYHYKVYWRPSALIPDIDVDLP